MIHLPSLRPWLVLMRRWAHIPAWLSTRLPWRGSARRPGASRRAEAPADPFEATDERPKGCGWFDSSYELGHGLLVCEHGADTAAQALATAPLADWLDFQLSGWRSAAPAQEPAFAAQA